MTRRSPGHRLRLGVWHAARRHWQRLAAGLAGPIAYDARTQIQLHGLKPSDRVLDVGRGTGSFVVALANGGIREPRGVDPFIASLLHCGNGAMVHRCRLGELAAEPYDVVFVHHSLAHVADPVAMLRSATDVLKSDGRCVVRIPTTSSQVFDTYRENWVDLDPPRHFFVPLREAMRLLGERCDLTLASVVDASVAFQFLGSELYLRDRALTRGDEYVRPEAHFEPDVLAEFAARAEALNASHRGDQAIFAFRKAGAAARMEAAA